MTAKLTSRPTRRRSGIARRMAAILDKLDQAIADAKVELNYTSPLELLVATILSAQSTAGQPGDACAVSAVSCSGRLRAGETRRA
jgi:hypothetical protein